MAIHQMYQIMANPNTKANPPRIKAVRSVFLGISMSSYLSGRLIRGAFFLHIHKGIDFIYYGYFRKVVDRGRRRCHPLQGATVPGITSRDQQGVSRRSTDAEEQLNSLKARDAKA